MDTETQSTIDQMNAHISQFKEMSHRAKSRLERLAEISMSIEGDLKQKEFADRTSELFGISAQFEEKLEALIHDYEIERNQIANEA